MNLDRRSGRGALVAGIAVISIGVILLLNQFGVFPVDVALRFWPVVLVVVGLVKALTGKDRGERVFGGILILGGTILQLNSMGITHITWNQAWPMFIIIVGVMLIIHALTEKPPYENLEFTTDPHQNSFYVFGGGERQVTAKDFQSAKLGAIFGGYKLDLTRADMAGNEAYVEANAFFGGGEIRVPINWSVVMQGTGIFGAYDDKTQYVQTDPAVLRKTLYVRGVAVFGGIEIKN
jgi:predicted membrane protein